MNNRRRFLMQTGMAATAVIASKPFKVLAKANSSFSFFGKGNSITIVHTNNFRHPKTLSVLKELVTESRKKNNILLLDTGCNKPCSSLFISQKSIAESMSELQYDATIPGSLDFENRIAAFSDHNNIPVVASNFNSSKTLLRNNLSPYKIIRRGGIKIGIIGAATTLEIFHTNVVDQINIIAEELKEKKRCDLIICISNLGFKNKNKIDDSTLASESKNIDVIIGSSGTTLNKPFICLNKKGSEVLINHTANDEMVIGQIEISFNSSGHKKKITYANLSVSNAEHKWNKLEV